MNDFGDYLRSARRRAGFKRQAHLAEVSGVSQATISRLEDGIQKPSAETLVALSEPLDISLDELMRAAGYLKGDESTNENFSSCQKN